MTQVALDLLSTALTLGLYIVCAFVAYTAGVFVTTGVFRAGDWIKERRQS